MKKIFVFIILICLSCLFGCEKVSDSFKTYGDFQYRIIQLNDEGKIIYSDTENKNAVDEFIRIIGLSEEGRTKEIIIVPHYIDGIEVREVGKKMPYGYSSEWESELLRRVYVPFSAEVNVGYCSIIPNLERVIVLEHEKIGRTGGYITSYKLTEKNYFSVYGFVASGGIAANVSYMFNYDEAPNHGYYWIDDYDYGTNITYIPDNPTRDGYIFDGWYKEKECINKWDFDVDKLPEELYDNDVKLFIYQETILYAKWVKDE